MRDAAAALLARGARAVLVKGGHLPDRACDVIATAEGLGLHAILAGSVQDGPREVILEPVGVRYTSEQLQLGSTGG